MARRNLINIDEKILQLTIEMGARGIDNVSVVKIAKELGITDPTVYIHFKTKANLLYQAYAIINSEFTTRLKDYRFETKEERKQAWLGMFDYLLINPDYTLYFMNYEHSTYYTPPAQYLTEDVITSVGTRAIGDRSTRRERLTLWLHIVDTTMNFAIKVFQGVLSNTEQTKEMVYNLILASLINNGLAASSDAAQAAE